MDTSTHHRPLDPQRLGGTRGGAAGLGRLGEELAAGHLVADDGLVIVARNWRVRTGEVRGELDIVAVDESTATVVICEVKARRDAERFGGAVTALSSRQGARIRALTGAFLREAALPFGRVRLDLVAIDVGRRPTLTHLEGVL